VQKGLIRIAALSCVSQRIGEQRRKLA
jgi:hypothetical protein